MKKIKALVCAVMVISVVTMSFATSAIGEVAGSYYATDIKAYVKGAPITSYNIGGKTVIDAEILNWYYWFDVYWYEDLRKLDITDKGSDFVSPQAVAGDTVEKNENAKPGDVIGSYYATDIKTYLNGKEIESYNLGGRTVIVAEEMKNHGYDVIWNEEERIISVEFTEATYSTDSDLGLVSSTEAGTLKKENFSFGMMTSVAYGSFNIENMSLDVPDAKIFMTGWGNTRYVPLVKTLDAIGASYEWNNSQKVLTVNYDSTKPLPLKEKTEIEYKTMYEINNNYMTDSVSWTFPIKLVVNGEEFSNRTGLHQYRFSESRQTVDAIIYEGIVYITSNTFADFMGYACDNGVDFYTKITENFVDSLNLNMPKDKNYMFSPLSIKYALGLLLNGTDGETKQEILNTLGIKETDSFNKTNKELMERLNSGSGYNLNIANAIWLNTDNAHSAFKRDYVNVLSEYYMAEAKEVNNQNAVSDVNSWVSEKTNQKINSLISNPDFTALLTNAVYFKAEWLNPFSAGATQKDIFTDIKNRKLELDFMNKTQHLRYLDENGVKATVLEYQDTTYGDEFDTIDYGRQMSMVVMMGDEKIENVTEIVNKAINAPTARLNLKLPKFEAEFGTSLIEILKNMGIKEAFTSNANLSKMISDDVQLTDAVHKTYIKVDEKGTEAAAVTGMMAGATSLIEEQKPIDLFFNKPFTYAIVEENRGEILFVGQFCVAQ